MVVGDLTDVCFAGGGTGGFLDIDITMFDPRHRIVWEAERETEGSFAFSAEQDGDYQICFSNRMSTLTPKTVSLFLEVGKAPSKGPSLALEPLEAEVRQISQGVEEVKNGQVRVISFRPFNQVIDNSRLVQNYLKNREMASRDTSESTNSRVLWYSVLETLGMLAVCAYQIHSIKSFFEVKRV